MGKSNKNSFTKSKDAPKVGGAHVTTTKVQPGDTLWSISSRIFGALNTHIRNPNIIIPNDSKE
jgi:LysM repeat protein